MSSVVSERRIVSCIGMDSFVVAEIRKSFYVVGEGLQFLRSIEWRQTVNGIIRRVGLCVFRQEECTTSL